MGYKIPISLLSEDEKEERRKKVRIWNAKWKKNHPEKYKEINKNYFRKHKAKIIDKHRVRNNAYKFFRKRILLERKVCEKCGSNKNLDLHHKEYINKPDKVMLLCRLCHTELHNKLKRGGT